MNIQIFGTRKSFDSKKAERFFKERGIKYQFIDMQEKGMSKGELSSVKAAIGIISLIDDKSKNYKKSNLINIRNAEIKEEILFKDQSLIKVPVVRNGRSATVGVREDIWSQWIEEEK